MVRGVNKKIIEVADPQNEFFERAILIVKEDFRDEDPERLRRRAGDYVSKMGNVALARRKSSRFWRTAAKAAVGAVLLSAVVWGLIFLL